MKIFLLEGANQIGPYSTEEVRNRLNSGEIAPSTLAWTEGTSDWTPVQELLTRASPPLPPTYVPEIRSPTKVSASKKNQTLAICGLTFGIIGAWFAPFSVPAVICGHIALRRILIEPAKYSGRGMALWAVGLGWIGLIFGIITVFGKLWMHSTINEGLAAYSEKKDAQQVYQSGEKLKDAGEEVKTSPSESDLREINHQLRNFYERALQQIVSGTLSPDAARLQEESFITQLSLKYKVTKADLRAESERIGNEVNSSQEPPATKLPRTGERFLSPLHSPPIYTFEGRQLPDNRAPLKISVPSEGEHYYIKVIDRTNRSNTEYLFIRSGESFEIKVPLGSYDIVYAVGKTWRGEIGPNAYFGRSTEFFKCEDVFVFSRNGDELVGYEIELMRQINGNLETESISLNEF